MVDLRYGTAFLRIGRKVFGWRPYFLSSPPKPPSAHVGCSIQSALLHCLSVLTLTMASAFSRPNYVSEDHLEELSSIIRDWQFTHGSLLKAPPRSGKSYAYPIGVSMFPSNFPQHQFESALDLQCVFNKLYSAVANDGAWLYHVLRNQITNDPTSMAAILWKIYTAAKSSGITQSLSLGIYRSDYMLHAPTSPSDMSLKQVEFNTYSVAGGSHSNLISQMHRSSSPL